MTDRRFNEAEVAAIFRQATEAQQARQQQLPSGEGMTLAELQEIGREVGIAPELVKQAANALTQPRSVTTRRFIGLPTGVGQTVDLNRQLTEAEWERLVVDLRETFDARGVVKREGSFRQWTNGNLQALVEPTPTGHRLRLRTFRSSAVGLMTGGMGMLGLAAAMSIAAVLGGAGNANITNITTVTELGVIGAGMLAFGAIRLPGWARLRRKQMEEVAARIAVPSETLPDQQALASNNK